MRSPLWPSAQQGNLDDETGLLYPSGDVDALADLLLQLQHDPALRTRLASDARMRPERFAPEAAAAEVTSQSRRVLGRSPAPLHRRHEQPAVAHSSVTPQPSSAGEHSGSDTRPSHPGDLRILIDAAIVKPQLGGIATYVSDLSCALARQPGVTVGVATSFPAGLSLPDDVQVIELDSAVRRVYGRLAWRERHFAALTSAWEASVVIAPTPELPLRHMRVPAIVVVLDVGPLQAPALYGRRRWARFALGVPIACHRAQHVVCISNATLVALRQCIGAFDAPCTVIGAADRKLPSRTRVVKAPPYILNVGSILDHKNVGTLVRAMNEPPLKDVRLCLAGPLDERERAKFEQWRADVADPDRITHYGFVDLEALADLYAGAAAVALPSLYEGFGLPLLEAMRVEAPVVASSIPAYREVGGDAATYVEQPLDTSEWASTLVRVLRDTKASDALSRRAADHVRDISWDGIGRQMADLARAVVAA